MNRRRKYTGDRERVKEKGEIRKDMRGKNKVGTQKCGEYKLWNGNWIILALFVCGLFDETLNILAESSVFHFVVQKYKD